jgi:hypothetical protein
MSEVIEGNAHDIPVSVTVGASGRLVVLTAAGNVWEWQSKTRQWSRMQPVPMTAAWDEMLAAMQQRQAPQPEVQEEVQGEGQNDEPGEPEKAQEA